MSRGKVLTLVGLAIAVLLFDAWFFLGNGEAAPRIAAEEQNPGDAGGFHLADLLPGSAPASAPRPAAVPWHDPATWPLPERRPPRRGRPRRGLMVRPAATVDSDGTFPLPERVSVILWRPEGALALLGDRLVREGDRVGPWLVREIRPDHVRLARADGRGEARVLPLGRPARPGAVDGSGKEPGERAPVPAAGTSPRRTPAPEEVP